MIKRNIGRKAMTAILISSMALSAFADGVGFYSEPYKGYVTEEGTPYSYEISEASSSTYPIGTLLLVNGESVYVNDYFPGLPDRTLLLNTYAAEKLGLLEKGWDDMNVVVDIPSETAQTETGWLRYKVASYETNQEAYDAILLLEHNNFKATAKRSETGCDVYISHITAYQAKGFEAQLEELGFYDYTSESEHNPYV